MRAVSFLSEGFDKAEVIQQALHLLLFEVGVSELVVGSPVLGSGRGFTDLFYLAVGRLVTGTLSWLRGDFRTAILRLEVSLAVFTELFFEEAVPVLIEWLLGGG